MSADINVPLQALTVFSTQTAADLAAAKTATVAAGAALADAVKAEADAVAQNFTARMSLDAMTGVAKVEAEVTKIESDPATKWYAAGAFLAVAVAVAFGLAKLFGKL